MTYLHFYPFPFYGKHLLKRLRAQTVSNFIPGIRMLWDDSANSTRETDVLKLRRFWTLLLSGLQSSTRLTGAVNYSMYVDDIVRFQHILSLKYQSSTYLSPDLTPLWFFIQENTIRINLYIQQQNIKNISLLVTDS